MRMLIKSEYPLMIMLHKLCSLYNNFAVHITHGCKTMESFMCMFLHPSPIKNQTYTIHITWEPATTLRGKSKRFFNPIHGGGGCQFGTTFSDISRTFKRVNIPFRNFLTFPKYEKQKYVCTGCLAGTDKNFFCFW